MDAEEKAERVLEMICDPELSFQEIAREFDFSSPSHLTAYCRRMYGMPPTLLREKSKNKRIFNYITTGELWNIQK